MKPPWKMKRNIDDDWKEFLHRNTTIKENVKEKVIEQLRSGVKYKRTNKQSKFSKH